jgi:hypothetical protein
VHAAQITKCGGRARAGGENSGYARKRGWAVQGNGSVGAKEARGRHRDRERRGCRARGAARCRVGSTVLSAPPYREWHCSRTCFFLTIVWGIKWRHVGCSARARKGRGPCLRLAPADQSNTGRRRFRDGRFCVAVVDGGVFPRADAVAQSFHFITFKNVMLSKIFFNYK